MEEREEGERRGRVMEGERETEEREEGDMEGARGEGMMEGEMCGRAL